MQNMKRYLLPLLALGLIGATVGYTLWNKPHKNMENVRADLSIGAAELFNDFNTDENAANAKYLGKTIAVTGQVKEVTPGEDGPAKVSLETGSDFGVLCELDPLTEHARTDFQPGETVTLKGDCAGFNFDVQMSRCVEVK
jgi:hypothetical protein